MVAQSDTNFKGMPPLGEVIRLDFCQVIIAAPSKSFNDRPKIPPIRILHSLARKTQYCSDNMTI